jgi:magnesium-transporting ATPase (P-type)
MTLIKSFKATSIRNAFILNSLVTSITIVVAIMIKHEYNELTKNKIDRNNLETSQIVALTIIAFMTSMIVYTLLFIVFGFGEGMLVVNQSK